MAVANSLAGVRGRGPAGRVHDQRHRRARRQRRARRDRHGPEDPARLLRPDHRTSRPSGSTRSAGWSRRSPAWPSSGTRRSSAGTPSPTSRASTRTACSRSGRPTRSCGPRRSASPRPTSSWASTRAATPCATASTELGYHLNDAQLEALFDDFKALADKKKEVYDEDLVVLIEKHIQDVTAALVARSACTRPPGPASCRRRPSAIRRPDGQLVQDAAIGDGPVDAIFKAVERVTGIAANLHEFAVRGVTAGKDAQGEVSLELEVESDDRTFRGRAASTDIIEASAEAYINAVNAIAHPPRARPAAGGHRPAGRGGLTRSETRGLPGGRGWLANPGGWCRDRGWRANPCHPEGRQGRLWVRRTSLPCPVPSEVPMIASRLARRSPRWPWPRCPRPWPRAGPATEGHAE